MQEGPKPPSDGSSSLSGNMNDSYTSRDENITQANIDRIAQREQEQHERETQEAARQARSAEQDAAETARLATVIRPESGKWIEQDDDDTDAYEEDSQHEAFLERSGSTREQMAEGAKKAGEEDAKARLEREKEEDRQELPKIEDVAEPDTTANGNMVNSDGERKPGDLPPAGQSLDRQSNARDGLEAAKPSTEIRFHNEEAGTDPPNEIDG